MTSQIQQFRITLFAMVMISISPIGNLFAQNGVLLDYTVSPPARDASALMELRSSTQGFLAPRVALTATNAAGPISSPADGLMIYNTATDGVIPNNVTPGYYYWSGSWKRFLSGITSLPPSGAAGGDLSGTYPSPSLINTGTAGTYNYVTFDAKGRETSGALRTITGTTKQIDITNGDFSANPNVGINPSYTANLKASANMTGGGTVTWSAAYNFSWSSRFIVISNGRGTHFGTSGYFDISLPANATVIPGSGGSVGVTVSGGSIAIPPWQALYYQFPISSTNGSIAANFKLVSYTSDFVVPETWVLVAVRNGDDNSLRLGNGMTLRPGQSSSEGSGSFIENIAQAEDAGQTANIYLNGRIVADENGQSPDRWIRMYSSGAQLIESSNDLYVRPAGTLVLQPGYPTAATGNIQIKDGGGTQYGILRGDTKTFGLMPEFVGNPASKLSVQGNISVGSNTYATTAAPTNGMIVEGNVGIGNPSPGYKLDVSGNERVTGGMYMNYVNDGTLAVGGGSIGGNDAVLYVENQSSDDWGIKINKGAYDYGMQIEVANSAPNGIRILGTGTERFRVRGDGVSYQPFIYDNNDNAYYLDPNGTSFMSTIKSNANIYNAGWYRGGTADDGHVRLYGNSRQMVFRTDGTTQYSNNGGYPFIWNYGGDDASNRRMILSSDGRIWTSTYGWLETWMATNGADNLGNHTAATDLNMNGLSINSAAEVYVNNWVRHNDNDGTYWSNNEWHIYPKDASDMYMRVGSGNGGICGTLGNTTPRGYVHWTTSNEIGFLNSSRSWSLRVDNSGNSFHTASSRAPIFYDLDNTAYYANPASTSIFNELDFNDANTRLFEGSGNSVRVQTNNGYLDIGAQNGSWLHMQSDRASFYFNPKITVDGNVEPYTANTRTLGTPALTWNNGYFTNLTLNGVTITSWPSGADNLGNHTATTTLDLQGNAVTGSAGTVLDAGGGWHRTYGQTGWYNGTYSSGMYATTSGEVATYNGSYLRITGGANGSGNLRFDAGNPYIKASSYFIAPGGAYFNSLTVYTEAQYQCRGGIHNDNAAELTIAGGTSARSYFSGYISGMNGYTPSNYMIRLTPNLHLNSNAGNAVILNWDNGTTGTGQVLRVGDGAGTDVHYIRADGYNWSNTSSTSLTNVIYAARPYGNYGPGRATIYGYRYGTGDGSGYGYTSTDAAVQGFSFYGNLYSFGVAGHNWNDYSRTGGVIGSDWSGGYWTSLGYKNSGGTGYGLYYTSAGAGGGYLPNNASVGIGAGGYGGVIGSWTRGDVMGQISAGELFASYNMGNEYTSGYQADLVNVGDKRVAAYAATSTDVKIYDDGEGSLNGTSVYVAFGDDYTKMLGSKPRVTISPIGASASLYLKSIDQNGFTVACDNAVNIDFTWIAVGKRIDADSKQQLHADIANKNFDTNMKGVMFNENNKEQSATPVWYDGNNIRFDAAPEEKVEKKEDERYARMMEESKRSADEVTNLIKQSDEKFKSDGSQEKAAAEMKAKADLMMQQQKAPEPAIAEPARAQENKK